jgi:intein/homing endonuclease
MNFNRVEQMMAKLPIRDYKTQKLVPFIFTPSQRRVHEALRKQNDSGKPMRCIILKSRRQGISTYSDALLTIHCMSRAGTAARIITHDFSSSKALFKVPKGVLSDCVPGEQPLMKSLNLPTMTQHKITFAHKDGDSELVIATAGNVEGGRGMSLTDLHLSEMAMYPSEGTFAALLPTVPSSNDTIIIIESTAKGKSGTGKPFYDFWCDSVQGGTGFVPIFLSWLEDLNCVNFDLNVDDAPIGEEEKLLMNEGVVCNGVRIKASKAQIAWRRAQINSPSCRGVVETFDQEYPRCLLGDTLVSTNKGIIPIESAKGCKESESGPILEWMPQPPSKIYCLLTKQGRILYGTGDHPIAVPDGFIRLSELTVGQVIELRPPMFTSRRYVETWFPFPGSKTSVEIDIPWAKFLGYFMGDGSWYKGNLSIVCDEKDEDVIEDVRKTIATLFRDPYRRTLAKVQGKKGAVEWRLGISSCLESFCKLGIVTPHGGGRYTRKVHVPECVLRSPVKIVRAFLRSLFECDGSASRNKVRFGSCHLKFIRDIQLLLLGFGINSRILANPKRGGSGKTYTFYELGLNVEASKLFHDSIGFIGNRKSSLRPKETQIGRPCQNIMQDSVMEVFYDNREAVTYNLTVGEAHVFSANGILTHNTPDVAFISTGLPAFTSDELLISRNNILQPAYEGIVVLDDTHKHVMWKDENVTNPCVLWEKPRPDCKYYFGVDAARGIDGQDFSAVVGVEGDTGNQVMRYEAYVKPEGLAYFCFALGMYFNRGMLCIELTGNLGYWVQTRLRDFYHYPNLYRWRGTRDDKIKSSRAGTYGWETTYRSRENLMTVYRESIGNRMFTLRDEVVMQQMELASRKDPWERWEIVKGHDDVMFAAMLANMARYQWHPRKIEVASSAISTDAEQTSRALSRLNPQTSFEHLGSVTAAVYKQLLRDREKWDDNEDKRQKGLL